MRTLALWEPSESMFKSGQGIKSVATRHTASVLIGVFVYISVAALVLLARPMLQREWLGAPFSVRLLPDPLRLFFEHLLILATFIAILYISLTWRLGLLFYILLAMSNAYRWLHFISFRLSLVLGLWVVSGWVIPITFLAVLCCLAWKRHVGPGMYIGAAIALQLMASVGQLGFQLSIQKKVALVAPSARESYTRDQVAQDIAANRRRYKGQFRSKLPPLEDMLPRGVFPNLRSGASSRYPLASRMVRFTPSTEQAATIQEEWLRRSRYVQRGCDTSRLVSKVCGDELADHEVSKYSMRLQRDYLVMVLYAATPEREVDDYRTWDENYHSCLAISQVTGEVVCWTFYP